MTAERAPHPIREATAGEADAVGRLLDAFNREYDDPSPGADALAERVRRLLAGGDTVILLGGEPGADDPEGLAVLRFRLSIWGADQECYLAELYVVPHLRGQGRGRALMEAARALYESLGFVNSEDGPGGPPSYFYERPLP
jgi:GNAT superfamily N-acetyltransferase